MVAYQTSIPSAIVSKGINTVALEIMKVYYNPVLKVLVIEY